MNRKLLILKFIIIIIGVSNGSGNAFKKYILKNNESIRTAKEILPSIKHSMPNLRNAYNQYLKIDSNYVIKLLVEIEVKQNGMVKTVKYKNENFQNNRFTRDVLKIIQKMRFTEIKEEKNDFISFPLSFYDDKLKQVAPDRKKNKFIADILKNTKLNKSFYLIESNNKTHFGDFAKTVREIVNRDKIKEKIKVGYLVKSDTLYSTFYLPFDKQKKFKSNLIKKNEKGFINIIDEKGKEEELSIKGFEKIVIKIGNRKDHYFNFIFNEKLNFETYFVPVLKFLSKLKIENYSLTTIKSN